MRIVTAIGLLICSALLGVVHADDGEASAKTIVYASRNAPANALAETLAQFLEETGGRVVADSISNVLLIQTTPDNQERVLAILQQLDRTPSTFRMQLHLLRTRGEALAETDTASLSGRTDEVLKNIERLKSAGRVRVANRIELTAVENQLAFFQVGEDIPLASSTMAVPGRGASTNYRNVSVGTIFKVQARLSGESDIVSEIDFEKTEVGHPNAVAGEETTAAPQGVSRLTHQTTSRTQAGHSLLAGTLVSQSPDRDGAAYLILSASIVGRDNAVAVRRPSAEPVSNTDARHLDSRYLEYYRRLVAKYDQNNDKSLDAEERSKMSKDCSEADTNKDGLVSVDEYAAWSMK